jgi:hypothetical protein
MIDVEVPSLFFLIGFVIWVAITAWQRRQRLSIIFDFNRHLLDRLGSAKDFTDFVQTEAGARFMRGLTTAEPASASVQLRIMVSVQIGIILSTLGLGLLALATSRYGNRDELTILGVIAVSVGLGFLLSTLVSYRLARAFGTLPARG